jgi:tagatose 6-phosphate kinase
MLRLGVACGAANAASEETGFVQQADVLTWLPQISMARL